MRTLGIFVNLYNERPLIWWQGLCAIHHQVLLSFVQTDFKLWLLIKLIKVMDCTCLSEQRQEVQYIAIGTATLSFNKRAWQKYYGFLMMQVNKLNGPVYVTWITTKSSYKVLQIIILVNWSLKAVSRNQKGEHLPWTHHLDQIVDIFPAFSKWKQYLSTRTAHYTQCQVFEIKWFLNKIQRFYGTKGILSMILEGMESPAVESNVVDKGGYCWTYCGNHAISVQDIRKATCQFQCCTLWHLKTKQEQVWYKDIRNDEITIITLQPSGIVRIRTFSDLDPDSDHIWCYRYIMNK